MSRSRPARLADQLRRVRVGPRLSVMKMKVVGRPTIEAMSLESAAFTLSPEHDALRESIRALADEKIAPHPAKVDPPAELPQEAHDALFKAGMHAVPIPQGSGGVRPAPIAP